MNLRTKIVSVCVCVRVRLCVCMSVRKIVNIRSSLKYIPLFDVIHTSMIVATHAIDYDSPESQADVDYVLLHFCSIPWSCSHVLCQRLIIILAYYLM